MNDESQKKFDWLQAAMRSTDLKPTPFAKAAGISPSTLTRFLKDPANAAPPQDKTLDHIARNLGIPPFKGPTHPQAVSGFAEDGAIRLTPSELRTSDESGALRNIFSNHNDTAAFDNLWVMQGRGLENRGIFDRDWLMVDYDAEPSINDIVCISLRDEENFRAKTVFRAMVAKDPVPVCIAATNDANFEPKAIFVDGIRAKIYGVVTMTLRKYSR